MKSEHRAKLRARIERQRAFFSRNEPGDLLVYTVIVAEGQRPGAHRLPNVTTHVYDSWPADPVAEIQDERAVGRVVDNYVRKLRNAYDAFYAVDDDAVPTVEVHAGAGSMTAAMTGRRAVWHPAGIPGSWCQANMGWDEIAALRFDPDNPWVQFAAHWNWSLWRNWDEDFFSVAWLHRSPLDAAWGIRGQQFFEELYLAPEAIHRLIDWCADWIVELERHVAAWANPPKGWGQGAWSTCLPERAVWVNGDTVDLIKREMQPVFDRPYVEKAFAAMDGGFFHHHGVGAYQVDLVAHTAGMLVHEIWDDPNLPTQVDKILHNSDKRERFVAASRRAPMMIHHVRPRELDRLLPIVREGRFILVVVARNETEAAESIAKVRSVSNLSRI